MMLDVLLDVLACSRGARRAKAEFLSDDARRASQRYGALQRRSVRQGHGGGCCLRACGAPSQCCLPHHRALAPPARAPVQVPGGLVHLYGAHAGGVGHVMVPVFRCREPSWRRGRWQKDLVPDADSASVSLTPWPLHLPAFPMVLWIRVGGMTRTPQERAHALKRGDG